MLDIIWNIASFIVALGILVAVHEWGHFIVARWCGVKVLRFSIGFGKIIWSRYDKHGTEFAIAAIPLGGYVKMLDERVDPVSPEQRHEAFNQKTVWQRFAIVSAGPVVNFIFAVIVLAFMFMLGVSVLKPKIGEIIPNSIAAQANLPNDGEIVSINNHKTLDWQAVNYELLATLGHSHLSMVIAHDGGEHTYRIGLNQWRLDDTETMPLTQFGINPAQPKVLNVIGAIAPNSAAARAGLKPGDKILKIDGTLLDNWEQTVAMIKARPGEGVTITIARNSVLYELDAILDRREMPQGAIGLLGVTPTLDGERSDYVLTKQYGFVDAVVAGIERTGRLMSLSVSMLGKLFTGDVAVESLSGPVGIAQGAGASASIGFVYFLSFLALISVNLGILNLLPLPMLDGGHLMFFIIEWLRGKPLSEDTQEKCLRVGAAILFTFMSIAIFNDIMRLT
ncbi:sigma E protease regulator RseP [Alteromonas sp. LMIT006]|uniref:sigma E protease regulator RseP n=1 Tax=Alteromonadaceae TaxID=72275 RepID=UPI0020CA6089|nr:sigma E protease regulator RseP [Alteromonas sp. LMIT006]UTP72587.1 sigma E protease regulator RseP [Alteromonas sp. LMIT006]